MLELDLGGFLRGDPAQRWAGYDIAIKNQVLTPNEVREAEGYNPRTGGDEFPAAPAHPHPHRQTPRRRRMGTRPSQFRQADLTRALRAARTAGFDRVEFDPVSGRYLFVKADVSESSRERQFF